jgi:hypothetical protein
LAHIASESYAIVRRLAANRRGDVFATMRKLIKTADPDGVEEWKWRGVPTWYHAGIICTGETYKAVVKPTSPVRVPPSVPKTTA